MPITQAWYLEKVYSLTEYIHKYTLRLFSHRRKYSLYFSACIVVRETLFDQVRSLASMLCGYSLVLTTVLLLLDVSNVTPFITENPSKDLVDAHVGLNAK